MSPTTTQTAPISGSVRKPRLAGFGRPPRNGSFLSQASAGCTTDVLEPPELGGFKIGAVLRVTATLCNFIELSLHLGVGTGSPLGLVDHTPTARTPSACTIVGTTLVVTRHTACPK